MDRLSADNKVPAPASSTAHEGQGGGGVDTAAEADHGGVDGPEDDHHEGHGQRRGGTLAPATVPRTTGEENKPNLCQPRQGPNILISHFLL